MRVALNTYPMAFAIPGGGERQLHAIYSGLASQGVQPLLYDPWQPRLDEIDLMHFFSVVSGSLPFCHFIKNQGLPLVVSPNMWIDDVTIESINVDEVGRQLNLADAVVVNSAIEADSYCKLLGVPEDKIHIVMAGLPDSFMDEADPEMAAETLDIEGSFVLCVASLHPNKNQLALINCLKSYPDVKLVLFGHIRDKEYADMCLQQGGDQVLYAGAVPHSANLLRSAMAACSAFVLPSFVESPSVASLEAAAQGAQLILTRVGSEEEYFGQHARYVDPNNPDELAAALGEVLSRSSRNSLLQALVASKYTIRSTCKHLIRVYNKVL